jgi:hypothetical protein
MNKARVVTCMTKLKVRELLQPQQQAIWELQEADCTADAEVLQSSQAAQRYCQPLWSLKQDATTEPQLLEAWPTGLQHTPATIAWLQLHDYIGEVEAGKLQVGGQLAQADSSGLAA